VASFIDVLSPGTCSAQMRKKIACKHPAVYYIPANFPPDWCGLRYQGKRHLNLTNSDPASRTCNTSKTDARTSGPPALPGCAHLFVNFGQWPASECARGGGGGIPCNTSRPWTLDEYRASMRALVRNLVWARHQLPALNVTVLIVCLVHWFVCSAVCSETLNNQPLALTSVVVTEQVPINTNLSHANP
jgi:hypothetical protein